MLRLKNLVSLNQRSAKIVLTASNSHSAVTSAESGSESERIVLPKRIKRGPIDVLTALARTVGRDPTASNYKFHDDPHLIPYTEHDKKGFALAQEAGRKTARWIKSEHATYFQVRNCRSAVICFELVSFFFFFFLIFCAAHNGSATDRSIYAD